MHASALILIDVQQGFDNPRWGIRNNPQAEHNMGGLLSAWRENSWPVIHVCHSSTEPDSPLRADAPGHQFKDFVQPQAQEPIFEKNVNSAFIGTELHDYLTRYGFQNLVMVGLTTDHCVSTSVRMAANLGYQVTLVSDATATFDRISPDGQHFSAEEIHQVHLASLNQEFCQVQTTQQVLAASSLS